MGVLKREFLKGQRNTHRGTQGQTQGAIAAAVQAGHTQHTAGAGSTHSRGRAPGRGSHIAAHRHSGGSTHRQGRAAGAHRGRDFT